jgi:uncharacterized protein YjbI with pentapeptide repeats
MVDRPPQPADDASTKAYQRRRLTWRLAGVGLLVLGLLVVVLLACVLWIPRWLYPSLTDTDLQSVLDASKVQELKGARLKLQNDARTTLLQGLGALVVLTGAGIGAGVTLRQVRASHDQLKLSEQGQFTDRYTKAIDQLDDKKALTVRLGGLYALERIARDSRDDRATIAEVLCAYVRTAPRPEPPARRVKDRYAELMTAAAPAVTPAADPASLTVRAPDVQVAAAILGRWRKRLGEPPPVLDLHNADLQGASLEGAELHKAILYGAKLQDAYLVDAQLQDANLDGAQLQDANLDRAQLRGVILVRAQLQGALLNGAELQDASLGDADLQGARLVGAKLQKATLYGAQLQDASLNGADLQGARLDGAKLQDASLNGADLQDASLDGAQLQGAKASEATRWPEEWNHARARAAGVQFR